MTAGAVTVVGLQLGALGGPGTNGQDASGHQITRADAPDAPATYRCNGTPVPREVLDAGRSATDLAPEQLAALESMDLNAGPDWGSWTVLEESESTILLIRPSAEQAGGPAYELYGIELAPPGAGAMPVNEGPEPAWSVLMWTTCDVRATLDGLANLSLALDPDHPVDEDSTRVSLLVQESDCTGGADPTERIEVVSVRMTESTVEVLLGVRPLPGGDYTCIGNPPVPFTVELDEAIGDRTVIDAATYPERELRPGGGW